MKLSIIVPVYNMASEDKLKHCMDSLLAQEIEDYEIIAVDDASTDSSLEILKQYEDGYPKKVKVIHYAENKRQGGAKNEGLKAASGDWIGFIDSDDWIAPDFYRKLIARAEETGADVVGCDYSLVQEYTFAPGKVIQNNFVEQTGILNREKHGRLIMRPGSMVVKVYRHEVIQKNGLDFPSGIFYEDNCAGSLWSLYFTHFERVEEPLYFYYQHEVSTVHVVTEAKCRDRMVAAVLLYEECKARGFLEEYRTELEYRFAELYFVNTLFSYMIGMKGRKLAFVKELKRGMLERYPDFQANSYYRQYTDAEEQKMIAMLMQSEVRFFVYYRLLLFYRKVRKRISRGKQN